MESAPVETVAKAPTRTHVLGEEQLSIREDEAKRHAALAAAQADDIRKNKKQLRKQMKPRQLN